MRSFLSWVLWSSAVVIYASSGTSLYANPVLAGDYPDPSIIRVGADYWATATSGEWAPIFPLLHSHDRVDWQLQGAIFDKAPAWTAGDYWAPELTHDRSGYRVYYTARKKAGPLCVAVATAQSPAGPYKDRGPLICQEAGSIDASTVRDEKGALYLLWKEDGNSRNQKTPIWTQPLSPDGTRLLGERQALFANDAPWEGSLVEGPFALRHGDWFYLFYSGNACCGRECNYALGVARARTLLGPWEKNPGNPILAANSTWHCPGHGSIVTDERGRDFLLYHAYSARDSVYVGRQGLLDEVTWQADGWPQINGGQGPSGRVPPVTPRAAEPDGGASFLANFTSSRLPLQWQWPAADQPVVRIDPRAGGVLELKPGAEHSAGPGELPGAILARRLVRGDFTALVKLADVPLDGQAGLGAIGDPDNALGIAVGNGTVQIWRRQKGMVNIVATREAPKARVFFLRMTVTGGSQYSFAIGPDERQLQSFGDSLSGEYLPPWDRGVRVALTATGKSAARFHWLRLTQLAPRQ